MKGRGKGKAGPGGGSGSTTICKQVKIEKQFVKEIQEDDCDQQKVTEAGLDELYGSTTICKRI